MKRALLLSLTCAAGLLSSPAFAAETGTGDHSGPPPSPSAPAQGNDCRELLGGGAASNPANGTTAKPASRMEIRERVSAYRKCLQQQSAQNSETAASGH